MTNDLLIRKYFRRFATLDSRNLGFVQRQDYENAARRICEASDVAFHTGPGQSLVQAYGESFDHLARNGGRDPQISRQTFVQAMLGGLAGKPKSFERNMAPIGHLIFNVCSNETGESLGEAEFCRFLSGYRVPEVEAREAFMHLAPAQQGLSREKFIEHSRDFYCSRDEKAPGNWMFGPY
ncbi:EF-hand domain-containing protein [Streptomyces microflavus]|uniref:EF-hand domain-containing protein n=1 Tax=Streptomyces microflavus TaxID=1919 RepID=UPI003650195B